MSCTITRIDENGQPHIDPIFTEIVRYTQQSIKNNQDPDPATLIGILKRTGYLTHDMRVGDNRLEGVHMMAELNGFFRLAFGSQYVPFIIKARPKLIINLETPERRESYASTALSSTTPNKLQDYFLVVNPEGLKNLTDNTQIKFQSVKDQEEFSYLVYEAGYKLGTLRPPAIQETKFNFPAVEASVMISNAIQDYASGQLSLNFDAESREVNLSIGEERVTPKTIGEQIAFFQSAFRSAGIEVQFEYDINLPEKGKIISEAGKPVKIILNPTTMTADTHIHEFGHLLVELLGATHPAVKSAIEELKDTNLYKDVQKAYPELSGETLDKEVVVTAIGLAGAKINRTKPNLFQRIVNKILRALSRNLGTSETAVEKLTQTLLSGQFEAAIYNKPLSYFTAKSKASNEDLTKRFNSLVDDVKIILTERIQKLERASEELNETEIGRLKLLKEGLAKTVTIEQLSSFLDYSLGIADRAELAIQEIDKLYSENLSEDERLKLINTLYKVGEDLREFYGGTDTKTSLITKMSNLIMEKKGLLSRKYSPEEFAQLPTVKNLEIIQQRIALARNKMDYVAEKYAASGIPMLADLYMQYSDDSINDQINELITNIKTNNRLIALKKDDEYRALEENFALLKKAFKNGTLSKSNFEKAEDDFEKAKIELNIKQLENKKVTRQTLINELKEAQKDKSAFSLFLDPLIHSSQVSLQLFSMLLKNKFYEANDKTRDSILNIGEALKKYADATGRSTVNVAEFYKDIIEEHEYYDYDKTTGKNRVMKIAGFIQPLDVTKYKRAEIDMYRKLKEKYGKPDKGTEELKVWKKTNAAKSYYAEVSEWYKENSEEAPEAKKNLARLEQKRKDYAKLYAAAEQTGNTERMSYYQQELDIIAASINLIYDKNTKQFKNGAVIPKASKYTNPNYTKLQSNAAALEFYNTVINEYKKSQSKLGKTNQVRNSWEKFSYALPSIESDALQKVQQNGAINSLQIMAKENLQFLETDTNYGDLINANKENRGKHIPIFYTSPLDSSRISKDVASSIIMFSGMANMFEAKSELHGAVMVMRDAIEKREVLTTNASGNPILHKFNKSLRNSRLETKEGPSNNFKHLSEFIDTIFYGEEDLNENFPALGKEFSSTKLASKVASYIAMDNLAFNFLQIGNQAILDNIRLVEESIAGQFMSMKDLAWAKKEFHLALGGLQQVKDFGKFSSETKLAQAVEYFDGLQDVLSIASERKTAPKTFKAAGEILMAGQQIVENETAVTRMLGLLHSYQGKLKDKDGKVIMNEDGKPAHLWELFVKNEKTGKFEIDERVADREKIRRQVMNRISGLTKKTNQIKNKFDDATIQRRWWGKLVLLFRRYFMPSLRRYWGYQGLGGGVHRDMEMGVLTEGTIHSTLRLFRDTLKKSGNIVGAYALMSPMEKENVKRTAVQGAFVVVATAIVIGLTADDDEELTQGEEFLLYQAMRLRAELTQFANPKEFFKMIESPTAAIRTIKAATDLIDHIATEQLPYLITGDEDGLYYERKSGIHEKGDSKFVAKFEKLIPVLNGIQKSSDPEAAASWFTKD